MAVSGGVDWNKIPLGPISTWGYRAGKVYDILAFPCAATPEIWIKALWNAIPYLILTPLAPSWLDYLIIRIGGGHGRRRKGRFDVWDFAFLEKVPKGGVSWYMIRLASLGARALWYFAVIDAITGFLVNWISGVYQYAGCNAPGEPYAQCFISGGGVITPGANFLIPDWANAGSFIYGAGGGGITCTADGDDGHGPTLMYDANWNVDPLHPDAFQVPDSSLEVEGTPLPIDGVQHTGHTGGNYSHQNLMTFATGISGIVVTYRIRLIQGSGYAQIGGLTFSAHGRIHRDAVRPMHLPFGKTIPGS